MNPFQLFGRLFLAVPRVSGSTCLFVAQLFWLLLHRRSDKVVDALGCYGHKVSGYRY